MHSSTRTFGGHVALADSPDGWLVVHAASTPDAVRASILGTGLAPADVGELEIREFVATTGARETFSFVGHVVEEPGTGRLLPEACGDTAEQATSRAIVLFGLRSTEGLAVHVFKASA